MPFNPDNYFDIWNILAYEIIGGINLTIVIGMVLIAYFSLRYQVPFQVGLTCLVFWAMIVAAITNRIDIWIIIDIIIGGFFYLMLARMLRRG